MRETRPLTLSLLGWGALAAGFYLCLSGGHRMIFLEPDPIPTPLRSVRQFLVEVVFGDSGTTAMAHLLLGAAIAVCGYAVLHLSLWGARAMEAIAVAVLVLTIASTSAVAWELRETADPERVVTIGLLALVAVFLSVPSILVLVLLRTPRARQVLR